MIIDELVNKLNNQQRKGRGWYDVRVTSGENFPDTEQREIIDIDVDGEWGALILETTEDAKPEEKKEEVVHSEVGRSKEELARMMQTCVSCDDCPMTKDCIGITTQQCFAMWEKWLGDKGEERPVIRKLEENGNLTVSGMIKKLQEFENDGLGDKVVKFEDDMWGECGIHKSKISYVGKCVLIQ